MVTLLVVVVVPLAGFDGQPAGFTRFSEADFRLVVLGVVGDVGFQQVVAFNLTDDQLGNADAFMMSP
jgi:hypothetical protein